MNHFRGQRNGFCHSLIGGPISFAASWTDPKPQRMSTEGSGVRTGEAALPREFPFPTGSAQAVFPPTLLGWLLAGVGFPGVPNTLSACVNENIPSLMRSKAFLQPEILHTSPLNSCNSEKSKTSPQHVILEVSFPFLFYQNCLKPLSRWNRYLVQYFKCECLRSYL